MHTQAPSHRISRRDRYPFGAPNPSVRDLERRADLRPKSVERSSRRSMQKSVLSSKITVYSLLSTSRHSSPTNKTRRYSPISRDQLSGSTISSVSATSSRRGIKPTPSKTSLLQHTKKGGFIFIKLCHLCVTSSLRKVSSA